MVFSEDSPRKRQRTNNESSSNEIIDGKKHEEPSVSQHDDNHYDYIQLKEALDKALPAQLQSSPATSNDQQQGHHRGSGVGKFTLSKTHFESIVALQNLIMKHVPQGVTWGEGDSVTDPRRRRYAFLPGQRKHLLEMGVRIQTPGTDDPKEHENAMKFSTMDIEWEGGGVANKKPPQSSETTKVAVMAPRHILDALTAVTDQIRSRVHPSYRECVTIDQLVSVQPNHHNGARYLPAHLDFPREDGFGVVIATIGISHVDGSQIILIDAGDDDEETMSWSFSLQDGECYFLSGNARNKCLHGVICPEGQRATLNLRYGLHTEDFAHEQVERHWPD